MIPKTKFIWMNGEFIEWDKANVHVLSHTLHYGAGVFEGIRCYKTDRGPAIFRLKEHVDRLLYSINVLKMPFSYTQHEVCEIIQSVVRENQLEEGYIRPLVFYGYGSLKVDPTGNPVDFAVACWPWAQYLASPLVDVKTSEYIRIHPKSTVVDAKLCGHYLNSILGTLALQGTPYHEVLFLDEKDFISEGSGENFFMVKEGKIFTPKLDTILAGITRDTIISLAHQLDLQVIEAHITLEEAYEADEAFFTGTAVEITPIRSIDDHIIGNGEIGKISSMMKDTYANIVRGRKPDMEDYLTFVHEKS
jgi:branched-chain amino acid aminotransferase